MKCPICKTMDMVITERQGVEIDYCPECQGVWLDHGELEAILARSHAIAAAMELAKDEHISHIEERKAPVYSHRPRGKRDLRIELFD